MFRRDRFLASTHRAGAGERSIDHRDDGRRRRIRVRRYFDFRYYKRFNERFNDGRHFARIRKNWTANAQRSGRQLRDQRKRIRFRRRTPIRRIRVVKRLLQFRFYTVVFVTLIQSVL